MIFLFSFFLSSGLVYVMWKAYSTLMHYNWLDDYFSCDLSK